MLPIRIRGPSAQSLDEHIGWRVEQHNVIEPAEEPPHILRASTQKQDVSVLSGQELLNAVLAPDPVLARAYWRPEGVSVGGALSPHRERIAIRVHGLIPACGERSDERRLASSRQPCQQDALHGVPPLPRRVQRPTRSLYGAGAMPQSDSALAQEWRPSEKPESAGTVRSPASRASRLPRLRRMSGGSVGMRCGSLTRWRYEAPLYVAICFAIS